MQDSAAPRSEPWLDGLRGLAALIVLFSHASSVDADVVPGLDLRGIAKAGVWLFFMLSAYLLGGRLLDAFQGPAGRPGLLLGYGIRRVFRIMPLYLVVLAALVAWVAMDPALQRAGWGGFDAAAMLRHALLLDGRGHFWTVPVEMAFYALLPLPMLLLAATPPARRRAVAWALLALSAVAYLLATPPRITSNSLALQNYLVFFCLGLVVLVSARPPMPARAAALLLAGALAMTLLLHPRFLAWALGLPRPVAWDVYPLSAAAMALAFHAFASCPPLRRPLAAGVLPWFGRISFGLYLVHYLLMFDVVAMPWLPLPLRGAVILAGSTVLALALHHAVERPMLRVGRRLAARAEALPWGRRQPRTGASVPLGGP